MSLQYLTSSGEPLPHTHNHIRVEFPKHREAIIETVQQDIPFGSKVQGSSPQQVQGALPASFGAQPSTYSQQVPTWPLLSAPSRAVQYRVGIW